MKSYPLSVVGESFRNSDGTSRQAEIKRCRIGELVTLIRDPTNRHDDKAVMVISARGRQIGFTSRDYQWLAERIDEGVPVTACIAAIGAGGAGALGVVISVRIGADTDEPDGEALGFSPAAARDALALFGGKGQGRVGCLGWFLP